MATLYIPARGQAIPMPGNRPDWPQDGQPINPIDAYQARLVRDGDLVVKPDDPVPPMVTDPPLADPAIGDAEITDPVIDPAKLTAGKITGRSKPAKGGE